MISFPNYAPKDLSLITTGQLCHFPLANNQPSCTVFVDQEQEVFFSNFSIRSSVHWTIHSEFKQNGSASERHLLVNIVSSQNNLNSVRLLPSWKMPIKRIRIRNIVVDIQKKTQKSDQLRVCPSKSVHWDCFS